MEKTRKLFILITASCLAVAVIVIGWCTSAVFASSEVYNWRMQTMQTPAQTGSVIMLPNFCERVKQMSNGRLNISLFTGGQLTPTAELHNALKTGMVDMAYTSGAYYAGSIPEAGLEPSAFAPLIYRELDDVIEVYRLRGLNEIIREGYAKYGIYFVDIITYGAPGTHWSKRPLHGVADFKGYKVRGFGHFNTVFKSLGATPTSIPHTEVYSALAQGVIDGSASDGLVYKEQRLYEVAPYYYLPGWMPSNAGGNCILVSMKSWNKLTDDLKAILKEAISATSDDFRHRTYMEHEQMLKEFGQFKSTLIVWPEEEMQKIRNVSVPILDVIAQRSPGCAKGIKIIKDYLNERGYMK